jgi:hypothetical protein
MSEDGYLRLFYICGAVVLVAAFLIILVPSASFQEAINNAPTFINGLTTSTSIVVAFGGAVNGFMFREIVEGRDLEFRRRYFEGIGFFIVPPMEAWASYSFLAFGSTEFAVKLSLIGFLTAMLVLVTFYLFISRELAHSGSATR